MKAGDEAARALRQDDVAHHREAPGAQIARGIDRRILDRPQAAIDRQHREGQQEIGQRDHHRVGAVDERIQRLVDQPECQSSACVQDAVLPRMLFQA